MVGRVVRGWPLPGWVFPVVAVVMAGLTFAVNLALLRSEFPLWSEVSIAWHEGVWIPGAVLAMLAMPIGAALSQKASPVVPGGRPREGAVLTLGHAVVLGCWAAVGHAVGMVPAVVRAVRGATWGVLGWQDVVVGSVGVVLLAVVGVGAGVVLRQWWWAPVVGFVVFVVMGVPNPPAWRPLGLFMPVAQFEDSTRFELAAGPVVFGVIAMTCLAVAITQLVTWVRRRGAAYQRPGEAVVWSGAVLVLGVTAFVWRPELYVVDRPVPRACEQSEGVEVCLHEANEPAREAVTTAATSLAEAGLAPVMRDVTDHDVAETDRPGRGEALVDINTGPFGPRNYTQNVREVAADSIVFWFTTAQCPVNIPIEQGQPSRALWARLMELGGFDRLTVGQSPGNEAAAGFFNGMDAEQLTTWVEEHQDEVATCTIKIPGQGR